MSWSNILCSVEGCDKPIRTNGLCNKHYSRVWRNGTTDKLNGDKRSLPYYHLWFERKANNLLCEEWLDINVFMAAILPKPEGNYILIRLRDGLFGPDNFKWQEHLKRKDGESNKDWWDRKRKARIEANPLMESNRNLKRKFNLTRDQFIAKSDSQNNVCAICKEVETSIDGRTGSLKNLAVDHCHITNKIRDLLCNRCNTTIGKAGDNPELLIEMTNYILKHRESTNGPSSVSPNS
jgi:hypothetical protein